MSYNLDRSVNTLFSIKFSKNTTTINPNLLGLMLFYSIFNSLSNATKLKFLGVNLILKNYKCHIISIGQLIHCFQLNFQKTRQLYIQTYWDLFCFIAILIFYLAQP